jgi:nitric oxide reductase subunit C
VFVQDPTFYRAGAVSSILVMSAILVFLTIDTLGAIRSGGSHVPAYNVINHHISYSYDAAAGNWMPKVGGLEPLFGKIYTDADAAATMRTGKLVLQSRACMDCHTVLGNGAYYAPDLTKSWLDPVWHNVWMPMTQTHRQEDAMVAFLMNPERYATWGRKMPNLHLSQDEAQSMVAYLKWLSAIDTNGFPDGFDRTSQVR